MSYNIVSGSKCSLAFCTSIRNQGVNKMEKSLSFFRFPKDHSRCASWVEKCNTVYLPTTDFDVLYKNHKLCSLHFEDRMFSNYLRNRLSPTAVPTLFVLNPILQIDCEDNVLVKSMELNDNILLADDISTIIDPRSCFTSGPSFIPDRSVSSSLVSTSSVSTSAEINEDTNTAENVLQLVEKSAIWIKKCKPEYLPSIDHNILNKNHKLCSLHFEDYMFTNFHKDRLLKMAIPTLFEVPNSSSSLNTSVSTALTTCSSSVKTTKNRILREQLTNPPSSKKKLKIRLNQMDIVKRFMKISLKSANFQVGTIMTLKDMAKAINFVPSNSSTFKLNPIDISNDERQTFMVKYVKCGELKTKYSTVSSDKSDSLIPNNLSKKIKNNEMEYKVQQDHCYCKIYNNTVPSSSLTEINNPLISFENNSNELKTPPSKTSRKTSKISTKKVKHHDGTISTFKDTSRTVNCTSSNSSTFKSNPVDHLTSDERRINDCDIVNANNINFGEINTKDLIVNSDKNNSLKPNSLCKKRKTVEKDQNIHDHCYYKKKNTVMRSSVIKNNNLLITTNDKSSEFEIPPPKTRKESAVTPIMTELFKSCLKQINVIALPLKWYAEIGHSSTYSNVIGFHQLSPFRNNFLRTVKKQVILTEDSSIFIHIYGYEIKTSELGFSANFKPRSHEDLENIITTLDKAKVCIGSVPINKDTKSTLSDIQWVESIGDKWRHKNCPRILDSNDSSDVCKWCKKFSSIQNKNSRWATKIL